MAKCSICGDDVRRMGTCQRICKYTKRTGKINHGKSCHVNCVEQHFWAHHAVENPQSLTCLNKKDTSYGN